MSEQVEFGHAGTAIRETTLWFELDGAALFGVLTEPVAGDRAPVCAVLLGAGAVRHTGPNRTWVELARRWAARGVPTVRLDLAGIGESDGERLDARVAGFYEPATIEQILAVLDRLQVEGQPSRFVLAGLCSGGYWALHGALADSRVAGAFMINPYSFFWSDDLVAERQTRLSLQRLRGRGWKRLVRGHVTAAQLRMAIRSVRPARVLRIAGSPVESSQTEQVNLALDKLRDQGTKALLLLGEGEPLYEQLSSHGHLEQLARWPNLRLERIPSRDHSFRALWLQQYVHESLDRALDRVLASVPAEQPTPSR